MTTCMDCGYDRATTRLNPRSPPLSLDKCLCRDCYKGAVEEILENALETTEHAQRLFDSL